MIMYNAESRQHMDGGAKKLRGIGNFKKIGFQMNNNDTFVKLKFLSKVTPKFRAEAAGVIF